MRVKICILISDVNEAFILGVQYICLAWHSKINICIYLLLWVSHLGIYIYIHTYKYVSYACYFSNRIFYIHM